MLYIDLLFPKASGCLINQLIFKDIFVLSTKKEEPKNINKVERIVYKQQHAIFNNNLIQKVKQNHLKNTFWLGACIIVGTCIICNTV